MEHFGPRENSLVKVDHLQRWSSDRVCPPGGGGVLPYITYMGMCRPMGS